MNRQMHLVQICIAGPTVAHFGMWRHPSTENRFLEGEWWQSVAKTLEDARFDAVFFADGQIFYDDLMVKKGGGLYFLDPLPVAATIAATTKHLGIGITVSSSLFEPYGLARSLATIDMLSGGRVAWNVVTSAFDEEARRYGMQRLLGHDERYDRADEVLEACTQLWGSIDPNAFVIDKSSGEFMDLSKVKSFEYNGKYVKTKGPLTIPPSPQGQPVIMQAGSSERGRQFAARWAELIFIFWNSVEDLRKFSTDMRNRMAEFGRPPEACAIMPMITVTVGETENIAREKKAYLDSLIDIDLALAFASTRLGVDLTKIPPDQPLKSLKFDSGSQGAVDIMLKVGETGDMTLADVARRFCTSGACPEIVGTPEQIADQMGAIFETGYCDGFMMNPTVMPGSVEDFARSVVPIFQERGLFRTEYPGTTLRASLAR